MEIYKSFLTILLKMSNNHEIEIGWVLNAEESNSFVYIDLNFWCFSYDLS